MTKEMDEDEFTIKENDEWLRITHESILITSEISKIEDKRSSPTCLYMKPLRNKIIKHTKK